MVLCELCNRIPVNAHQYKHQPDYESLLESAKTCELCRLIDQVCERNSQRKRAEEYRETIDGKYMLVNDTSITISEGSHQKDPEAEPKQAWRLVVTCGPTIRADFGGRKVVNAQAYGIAIYADEGSPAAEVIATRDVPPEGGSDRTFELISEWILTCTKKHVECRTVFIEQGSHLPVSDPGAEDVIQDRNVPLPSRILDLCAGPQSDRIRLIDSEGLTGCYSILSHCWGKSQHLVTTTSTLADRMEDIPYSQLPKTFQDAVDITRRLGLRYLWVDSLCIIQNCYKDWEYESSMMGQAFWFAYFTIAAASAVDGNGGCLMRRTTSDSSPIKLPFYDKDGKPSGYWYVRDWPHNFDTSVVKGPLQQRCWTLQERFLSRRIIFFAKDQVYFECRESIQTEIGWPDCKLIGPDHLSLLLLHNSVQLLTDKEISKMLLQTFWYSVIEDYTGRGLTKEEDKLPALSGLASLAAKYTKVPYYAGLWKAKLVDDLLWRTARYDQKENRQARPIKQRAPSWSWASVEGSISYALLGTRKLELGHIHDAVEDAAVEVEPLGQDMYGQVRSGTVTLSGWLVRAVRGGSDSFGAGESRQWFYSRVGEWFRRQVNIQMIAMSGYEWVRTPDLRFFGTAAFDDRRSEADETGFVDCILVKQRGRWDYLKGDPFVHSFFVLFLEPTGLNDHEYRRIGMGQLLQCFEFERGAKTRITIV